MTILSQFPSDFLSEITLLEIDPEVIRVSKEFFGDTMGGSWEDERLTVEEGVDAAEFLKGKEGEGRYDVIIGEQKI